MPYEFARDTVDFMRTGHVDATSPRIVDTLVNGAQYGNGEGGAAAKPTGLAK